MAEYDNMMSNNVGIQNYNGSIISLQYIRIHTI